MGHFRMFLIQEHPPRLGRVMSNVALVNALPDTMNFCSQLQVGM